MSSIIDKIKKLLALSDEDNGGTEAERELAAEKAATLMAEHRISQAQLEEAGEQVRPGIECKRFGIIKWGPLARWRYDLLYVLGENVDVDAIQIMSRNRPRGQMAIDLVGRPDSIAYVELMYAWLAPQIERHGVVEVAKVIEGYRKDGYKVGAADAGRIRRSYYRGAIVALGDRLKTATTDATGMDLVVSDRAALASFYGDDAPEHSQQSSALDDNGLESGAAAAGRMDVNPGNKVAGGTAGQIGAGA